MALLARYAAVADAMAKLMHPHVEAVVHDLGSGRIAHIANSFSKRRVGDSSLTELQDIRSLDRDVIGPYRKVNYDGRELRSVTAVLRDAAGRPIGLLCVNYDVSALVGTKTLLESLLRLPDLEAKPAALFHSDWREAVNQGIADFLAQRGASLSALSREEARDLVRTLQKQGLFQVRNAIPYAARVLGLSRATIYNHLKDGKRQHQGINRHRRSS